MVPDLDNLTDDQLTDLVALLARFAAWLAFRELQPDAAPLIAVHVTAGSHPACRGRRRAGSPFDPIPRGGAAPFFWPAWLLPATWINIVSRRRPGCGMATGRRDVGPRGTTTLGAVGAAAGAALGPVGVAVGGTVGGAAGGAIGYVGGEKVAD